jgi:capsular exopolysaccharide synthesis family protein
MSKFLNDMQKAQPWVAQVPDPAPLDVVSVIDAIKQSGALDTTVVETCSPNDLQVRVDKTVNAVVTGRKRDGNSPAAPAVEAYRALRTRVMRLQSSKGIRSIMLTSSVPAEGKTVTALNLALSSAQLGDLRILLVDADLRSRGLTRLLEIPGGPGLSDVLSGKSPVEEAILTTEHDNLSVIGAGSSSSNPAELFASARWSEFIRWGKESFDMILVDAPPILSLADAELIGAACDGALIVVKAFSTPREMAQKCALRLDKKRLMGIVFNGLPSTKDYHSYNYYVGSNGDPSLRSKVERG